MSRQLRPLWLALLVTAIIAQIVALSPSSIEEAKDSSAAVEPSTLIPHAPVTLAPGIPADRVPEYSVDDYNYVSTQGGEKQWNLLADHAYLYDKEKITHARKVKALLYDPDGKITVVTGDESKFVINQRDLEVFGNVTTTMPDGFQIHSPYMRYHPNERLIEIPTNYPVFGEGKDESGEKLGFNSYGLHYAMGKSEIILPTRVRMVVEKPDVAMAVDDDATSATPATGPAPAAARPPAPVVAATAVMAVPTPGSSASPGPGALGSTKTMIESDHCIIYRDKKLAFFTMFPTRPLDKRFVKITQPTLFSKGRSADLNYGDLGVKGKSKPLNYVILHDDVLIEDKSEDGSIRYGTGGQADFDAINNLIYLRKFPQVYQGRDTVTGDVILLHRDTDVVEIEHSNAFSQGDNSL